MTHVNDTIYSVHVMLAGLSIPHLCISHGILYLITNYQSRRLEQFRLYNKFHDVNPTEKFANTLFMKNFVHSFINDNNCL